MVNPEETFQTAIRHQQAGQLVLAEQLYRQILQVVPSQTDAWYQLGIIFCQKGQLQDAASCFQETIRLGRNDFRLCNNLGSISAMLGRLEEAILWHRRALELNSNYPAMDARLVGKKLLLPKYILRPVRMGRLSS